MHCARKHITITNVRSGRSGSSSAPYNYSVLSIYIQLDLPSSRGMVVYSRREHSFLLPSTSVHLQVEHDTTSHQRASETFSVCRLGQKRYVQRQTPTLMPINFKRLHTCVTLKAASLFGQQITYNTGQLLSILFPPINLTQSMIVQTREPDSSA